LGVGQRRGQDEIETRKLEGTPEKHEFLGKRKGCRPRLKRVQGKETLKIKGRRKNQTMGAKVTLRLKGTSASSGGPFKKFHLKILKRLRVTARPSRRDLGSRRGTHGGWKEKGGSYGNLGTGPHWGEWCAPERKAGNRKRQAQ